MVGRGGGVVKRSLCSLREKQKIRWLWAWREKNKVSSEVLTKEGKKVTISSMFLHSVSCQSQREPAPAAAPAAATPSTCYPFPSSSGRDTHKRTSRISSAFSDMICFLFFFLFYFLPALAAACLSLYIFFTKKYPQNSAFFSFLFRF